MNRLEGVGMLALLLATILFISTLASGGLYGVVASDGVFYQYNKITGAAWLCLSTCTRVKLE